MIKIVSILLLLNCYSLVYAQEGDNPFGDMITPNNEQFDFTVITTDSANKQIGKETAQKIEGADMYEYQDGDKIYLLVNRSGKWSSGLVSHQYWTSFNYHLVKLNVDGDTGVLVSNYSVLGRGGRYGGYDNNSSTYELINLTTGKVYYLGRTYENEGHWYKGYVANDTGSEEREMDEMDKDENWGLSREVLDYEIKVLPGKVVFENIVCDECEVVDLESVSAIEYVWVGDKLLKDKVITEKE